MRSTRWITTAITAPMADTDPLKRRSVLTGGAIAAAGASAGAIATLGAQAVTGRGDDQNTPADAALHGEETIPFYGEHQAGILTPLQAHGVFIALDLKDGIDRPALRRLMQLLTDDASRLTQGRAPLADIEPELATTPARLTITIGFGPGFVEHADGVKPAWLAPLPAFRIDRLREEFSHGDLLLFIAGDDPLSIAHAQRLLLRDARTFATVRWVQRGFRHARSSVPGHETQRNLFGQIDGTVNPRPEDPETASLIWVDDGTWMTGGTSLVLRRIAMDLETWDEVDRVGREFAVGRKLDTGAPLTGEKEHDAPDFHAVTDRGFPVIDKASHMRRAVSTHPRERILRRPFNYDDAPAEGEISDTGLLFTAFQADITEQFLPIQQRLADADLLNQWTTPIGSAVFAIPPGCNEGGYLGQTLLED